MKMSLCFGLIGSGSFAIAIWMFTTIPFEKSSGVAGMAT
jgi:hypothetical protein